MRCVFMLHSNICCHRECYRANKGRQEGRWNGVRQEMWRKGLWDKALRGFCGVSTEGKTLAAGALPALGSGVSR